MSTTAPGEPGSRGAPRRRRRWRCCSLALGALLLLLLGLAAAIHRARPAGVEGPEAEALARRMVEAVDGEAWRRTGAVRWTFAGSNRHLWDRRRGLARVRWGQVEVLLRAGAPAGRAWRGGQRVRGAEEGALLRAAHGAWINDSFWLDPVTKAFDPGTTRAIVSGAPTAGATGGEQSLLISYASGGNTPGDAYLWELDPATGRPVAWRMWVSILPLGGVRATWAGWTRLGTGAWVATEHQVLGLLPLAITDVAGAETLAQLEPGPDPFAPLLAPE